MPKRELSFLVLLGSRGLDAFELSYSIYLSFANLMKKFSTGIDLATTFIL